MVDVLERRPDRFDLTLARLDPPPYQPGKIGAGLAEIWQEIERLDLVRHVAELDAFGYTIIPPERAAPAGFAERLLAAVLDCAEERWGVRLDPARDFPTTGPADAPDPQDWANMLNRPTLYADFPAIPRAYEEALMNPVLLALVTYMLGYQCRLSSGFGAWIKGMNPNETFPLHFDGSRMSPPPAHAECCNTMYLLTDHSKEDGATCFVPGSHKLLKQPAAGEGMGDRVAATAKAGSLVVWHGNTWHGAFPKITHGLRISMPLFFCRPHLKSFTDFQNVPEEMLERNLPRFTTLLGQDLWWRNYRMLERAGMRKSKDATNLEKSAEEKMAASEVVVQAMRSTSYFGA